jgi:hypothetical protein
MKYTKPYSTERAHQVESYVSTKVFLEDLHADLYHDRLNDLIADAKHCDFEELEEALDDIYFEIAEWKRMEEALALDEEEYIVTPWEV